MSDMSDMNWAELPWLDDATEVAEYHYLWEQYGTGWHYEADAPRDSMDKCVAVQQTTWREGTVLGSYPELGDREFLANSEIVTHVATPKIRSAWNKVADG
jgi:hypothetical protein